MFFTDRSRLDGDVITLDGADGRHAAVVRRLRPGELVSVGDGRGFVAECVVTGPGSGSGLELAVRARREVPRPRPRITVIQAIPKGDRGELAVEEMTEVGVDRIVPWAAARCVPVWRDDKGAARWQVKAREAAKQSLRAWIPEVTGPVTTAEAARLISAAECAVLLAPGAEQPLGSIAVPESGELIVVIGPEGGITDDESAALRAAGAAACKLGPSVLRTSTAGAVAAAVVLSRSARWQ
jgi:16S rRNA (uracil1498-N3)-methyltransferase